MAAQTYSNLQHLLVIDGPQYRDPAHSVIAKADRKLIDILELPYNTGADRYNGHRIYGAATYLAKGDILCFLDEDNFLDAEHVSSLVTTLGSVNGWAFSLRKIVDHDDRFICNDDCESLGLWDSCLNDRLVDVGCYFLPKPLALSLSPVWYRKAREPGLAEVDRALTNILLENQIPCETSGLYTLNYRAGNTERSVQKEFFLRGNQTMEERYPSGFPWRRI